MLSSGEEMVYTDMSFTMVILTWQPCFSKKKFDWFHIICLHHINISFSDLYHIFLSCLSQHRNTQNFTQLGAYATCGVDCYIGKGNGCTDLEPYLPLSGNITANEVCNLQWGEIDDAFCALRVCAAKAIANPADGQTKEEYVNRFLSSQLTSSLCTFNYCGGGD